MSTVKIDKEQVYKVCQKKKSQLRAMLLTFVNEAYDELTEEKQHMFVKLLKVAEHDLHEWLVGSKLPADPVFQDFVLVIRYLAQKNVTANVACAEEII